MSVPEPVILCDPFYHSSNWFQEIIAGFRDAAAKDRNNSPIHIHSMGTIGQLRLEPGIPVIVTNSSLKNLTSAVQQLRQAGIPVILSGVDGAHFGSDICSVASDSALAMTQMVRYLLSYDRKRIALAGFWSSSRNDMAFLDAAVAAADRFGYPISPQSIFLWENQLDESLNAFFQKYEDYNAVICPNDTIAICLTRACRERDIRIPETLFVTGASNMRISQKFEPSITTISMDFREIGKEFKRRFEGTEINLLRQGASYPEGEQVQPYQRVDPGLYHSKGKHGKPVAEGGASSGRKPERFHLRERKQFLHEPYHQFPDPI